MLTSWVFWRMKTIERTSTTIPTMTRQFSWVSPPPEGFVRSFSLTIDIVDLHTLRDEQKLPGRPESGARPPFVL